MMKRIYICLLMLIVLSTATFAQKKGSPEYNAQLRATIIAMDSVLKYSTKTPPDILMKFADEQCAKFKNDPEVMDLIAEAFYLHGSEVYGNRRYDALKKMHPEYTQVYITEARLLHTKSWYEDAEGLHFNEELMRAAKQKIDSAKIVMPQSEEPYMVWIKRQAPYRGLAKLPSDLTLEHEIDELYKKFPKYPAYLETAVYFDEIEAKKDKNRKLDAAEFYNKAGEKGEMTAQRWTNYAVDCYYFSQSFENDKRFEKELGIKVTERGLKQFPNHPPLLRAKLWNEGKFGKWNDLFETSKLFFQYADTLKPSYLDYMWIAQAYENTKNYAEAINFLDKELELVKDTTERLNAMLNKVSCYNKMTPSQFEPAVNTFADYERLKKASGKSLEFYDYQFLVNAYLYQTSDSTIPASQRIRYFQIADSLCDVGAKATPMYAVLIAEMRLETILMNRYRLEYGKFSGDQAAFPEFRVAAERLYMAVQQQDSPMKDMDYYRMMKGYYWALIHFLFAKDEENQYAIAAKMTSLDMPSEMELTSLSASRKQDYQDWVNQAQDIYNSTYKKYGKKRK